jgi:hypothetical protein
LKWYNKRNAVVVPFKVRKDGYAVRARNRYRKWWVLKNVTFTLGGYSFGLYILFVYGIYTWGARLREIFC